MATDQIATTPSGVQIVYMDKAHRYKIGLLATEGGATGEKLRFVPSVSTILDKSVPKNLSGWVERMTVLGVSELQSRGRPIERLGPDAILAEMKAQNLRYWNRRDEAADRGTAIHTAFEQLAEGEVPKLSEYPEAHRGYVQAMSKWWLEFRPEPLHIELMVASWEHQFAGRMDLLAKVGGRVGVIDLKTSKGVRETHHYQTAGYRIAVEESGYPEPEFGAILRAGVDGTYEYVYSHATAEQFLALHRSHLAMKQFDKASRELAKEAKAA